MKVFIFLALVSLSLAAIPRPEELKDAPVPEVDYIVFDDLDADDNLTEEEFEEEFGLDPVTDPEEKERREEALEEAEAEVKEENEKYLNGEADWFEEINEFSDLPKDEFEKEKTGDVDTDYARGLLEPEIKPVDARSERYFASLLLRRDA